MKTQQSKKKKQKPLSPPILTARALPASWLGPLGSSQLISHHSATLSLHMFFPLPSLPPSLLPFSLWLILRTQQTDTLPFESPCRRSLCKIQLKCLYLLEACLMDKVNHLLCVLTVSYVHFYCSTCLIALIVNSRQKYVNIG